MVKKDHIAIHAKEKTMTAEEIFQMYVEGLITLQEAIAQLAEATDQSALAIVAMLKSADVPFYAEGN